MTGRDVVAAITRGARDARIRTIAATHYAASAPAALAHDHTREPGKIRTSDAGRCALEVWADVHGHLDLPENIVTQLTRFDIGNLYGAWLAALLKATLESEDNELRVSLEVAVEQNNIPGHIDALVERLYADLSGIPGAALRTRDDLWESLLVVEFKSTYTMKNKDVPSEKKPYQCYQATTYARAKGAPLAAIVTVAPAAFPAEDRFKWEDLDPVAFEMSTEIEFDRLTAALLEDPPTADPDATWRCEGCRYGACPKNRNPMARTLDLEEMSHG